MSSRLAWLGVVVMTSASLFSIAPLACGGDDASAASSDASADGSTRIDAATLTDGGPPRSFRLAAGGVQLLISGPAVGLQITPADLQTDVDVVEIHQEFYGVPWDDFKNGTSLPAAWDSQMKSLAGSARAMNKPVFLSISMLNGNRTSLAPKATTSAGGGLTTTDDWAAACYDFATAVDGPQMKAAYLAYVDYMMTTFSPAYLNVAVEVNLFFEHCPGSVAGLIDVANAAYDEAKSKKSDVVAFPSLQLDHLYGFSDACPPDADGGSLRATCFEANYAQIANLKRDRFAMSSYPPLAAAQKPTDLPADWFTRAASIKGETPLIAETGWNSSSLVAQASNGTCDTIFTSTENDEEAYLDFVLRSADTQHIDLVNWWSDRDLVVATFMTDCPCTFDSTWCSVLDQFRTDAGADAGDTQLFGQILVKAFGTMGLRAYDGTQKPAVYARWQTALGRPLTK